ncbi:DUF309 domain-containing protein [Cohnella faecalis]|uniref:DUF309 domain-containing protein n=1 Tax=Cohnella faecalis TaxID=2315694 RepID=A0A398CD49_9BACL|nr:DUF309 domain-containing protein [Cohnella faecalis]RIE00633.1 DUF309 domain-containing protein [Cohnella faecalis]
MAGVGRNANGLAGIRSDSRFLAFIGHFNGDRDYFECHEVMEELWLEEGRHRLLQGLLQAAVGLHHWDNGNLSGAAKLMIGSLGKLEFYETEVLGLDLGALRRELAQSLEELSRSPYDAPFRAFELVLTEEGLALAVERWLKENRSSDKGND